MKMAGSNPGHFAKAFKEVGTGSREENASKEQSRASDLIQSEPITLQVTH